MRKTFTALMLSAGLLFIPMDLHAESNHQTDPAALHDTNQQLTGRDVKETVRAFMGELIQETDKTGKVVNFKSKEELLARMEMVSDRKAAKPFVEELYTEQDGSLYLNPMAAPPTFNEYESYDMVQLDENRAEVVQHNASALYGSYTIKIEFIHDAAWKIGKIAYEQ